jgi:hypothetical protein
MSTFSTQRVKPDLPLPYFTSEIPSVYLESLNEQVFDHVDAYTYEYSNEIQSSGAEHVFLWGNSPLHLTMVMGVWCLGGYIYTLVSKSEECTNLENVQN